MKAELCCWAAIGLLLWGWALLSGCASVVSTVSDGHPNRKEILVTPGATAVMHAGGSITDENHDGLVTVPRGAGAFRPNRGRLERDGYMTAVIQGRVNWWILGNVLYGGPLGLGGDFIGGGAYSPTVVYLAASAKK
jgi:hypothetical protein